MICYKVLEEFNGRLLSPYVPDKFVRVYRRADGAVLPVKWAFVYTDLAIARTDYLEAASLQMSSRRFVLCSGHANKVYTIEEVPDLWELPQARYGIAKQYISKTISGENVVVGCSAMPVASGSVVADVFKVDKMIYPIKYVIKTYIGDY